MTFTKTTLCLTLALTIPAAFIGCGNQKNGDAKKVDKKGNGENDDHPTEGLHGGTLLEVGKDHAFHAEFLFDRDKKSVTIHILDGTGKKAKPIAAKEVIISANHHGEQETHKLPAKPMDGETDGKSSRFESNADDLVHVLREKGTNPKLLFTVDGKTRSGAIRVPKKK